jgi:palmitoyltransferase
MAPLDLGKLAIPGVVLLTLFLGYSSQVLFVYIDPGSLDNQQVLRFNALLTCLFIAYYRSCTVDPGHIPRAWEDMVITKEDKPMAESAADRKSSTRRWCRKCDMFKPPRAHHCKTCGR